MRKLLAVLSIFVFIIIALTMLFNTVLFGTAQLELKTLTELPDYQSSFINIRKGLSINTRNNQKEAAFHDFKNFLLDTYSNVFNNPNIEFQFFDEYSLVLKWIGRTNSNRSVFFIAEQFTQPLEKDFREAEMDSFKLTGEGIESAKITLISELEVLNHFLQKDILPEKNLYFIFPHHDSSILKINHAIAQAKVKPEFVLRPGGMIINDNMLDLSRPIALYVSKHINNYNVRLIGNNKTQDEKFLSICSRLNANLEQIDLDDPLVSGFIERISAYLPFYKKLLFSNQWILGNLGRNALSSDSTIFDIFSDEVLIDRIYQDSSMNKICDLSIGLREPNKQLISWLRGQIQYPEIEIDQAVQWRPTFNYTSAGRAEEKLNYTIKEIFENILTAPISSKASNLGNWSSDINDCSIFFHPLPKGHMKNKDNIGSDSGIEIEHLHKILHFYHRFIQNIVIE